MNHKLCSYIQCPFCREVPMALREELIAQRYAIEKLLRIAQNPMKIDETLNSNGLKESLINFVRDFNFNKPRN